MPEGAARGRRPSPSYLPHSRQTPGACGSGSRPYSAAAAAAAAATTCPAAGVRVRNVLRAPSPGCSRAPSRRGPSAAQRREPRPLLPGVPVAALSRLARRSLATLALTPRPSPAPALERWSSRRGGRRGALHAGDRRRRGKRRRSRRGRREWAGAAQRGRAGERSPRGGLEERARAAASPLHPPELSAASARRSRGAPSRQEASREHLLCAGPQSRAL